MRLLIIALILASMAFAQASPEDEINQCVKGCCQRYGGEWDDGGNSCQMNGTDSDYEARSNCELQCVYGATGVDTGMGACCCAPAAMLMVIIGAALKSGAGSAL
jgi:hypothetical protein